MSYTFSVEVVSVCVIPNEFSEVSIRFSFRSRNKVLSRAGMSTYLSLFFYSLLQAVPIRVPVKELSNGVKMPVLGLGTYQVPLSPERLGEVSICAPTLVATLRVAHTRCHERANRWQSFHISVQTAVHRARYQSGSDRRLPTH